MAYITNSDIEERLGPAKYLGLTDDEATGAPDTGRVTEAREGAEGEVDSYLARQYRVPVNLTAYPELESVLKSIALDLAEYRLHARRPPVPFAVTQKHDYAVLWLRRVAEAEILLPAESAVTENDARAPIAETLGEPRVFTRDELAGL